MRDGVWGLEADIRYDRPLPTSGSGLAWCRDPWRVRPPPLQRGNRAPLEKRSGASGEAVREPLEKLSVPAESGWGGSDRGVG